VAVLVLGEVDGAKGAAANLLLHQILVDAVLGGAVILAVAVLGSGIEGFLRRVRATTTLSRLLLPRKSHLDASRGGGCALVVS